MAPVPLGKRSADVPGAGPVAGDVPAREVESPWEQVTREELTRGEATPAGWDDQQTQREHHEPDTFVAEPTTEQYEVPPATEDATRAEDAGEHDPERPRQPVIIAVAAALALALLVVTWIILGGGDEPEPATPSGSPSATATATGAPTATPSGSAAPSATAAPSGSATPAPSATATPSATPTSTAAPTSAAPSPANVVALCTSARQAQSLRPTAAELTPEVIASYAPYVTALEELTAQLPEPVKTDAAAVTDFNREYAELDPNNPQAPAVTPQLQASGERLAQYLEETC